MKNTAFWLILWMAMPNVWAQEHIEKHLPFTGSNRLTLDIRFADSIRIVTWNKAEVWAQVSVDINNNTDNAAYLTMFDTSGEEVIMRSDFKKGYFDGRKNCCNETQIVWILHIPEHAAFTLETINGNVSLSGNPGKVAAKTISGYLEVTLPARQMSDLEMKTVSGRMYTDLDMAKSASEGSLPMVVRLKPSSTGVPVKLETISGDIFVRTTL